MKTFKVKIISCRVAGLWYGKLIGETLEVSQSVQNEKILLYYDERQPLLRNRNKTLYKEDCQEL